MQQWYSAKWSKEVIALTLFYTSDGSNINKWTVIIWIPTTTPPRIFQASYITKIKI